MLDVMLTNGIKNFDEKEFQFYLLQGAKSDLETYADARQCLGYADTIKDCKEMLIEIISIMNERTTKIKPMHKQFKGDNFVDYNQINPKKPLSVLMVYVDEANTFLDSSDDKMQKDNSIKNDKAAIVTMVRRIAQYGASLGVFLTTSTQRPTKDNLDPFIKAQSTIIVSFRQNNSMSSKVAIDSDIALKLEQREFAYRIGADESYGIVPFITSEEIKPVVKPMSTPGRQEYLTRSRKMILNDKIEEEEAKNKEIKGLKKELEDLNKDKTKEVNNIKKQKDEIIKEKDNQIKMLKTKFEDTLKQLNALKELVRDERDKAIDKEVKTLKTLDKKYDDVIPTFLNKLDEAFGIERGQFDKEVPKTNKITHLNVDKIKNVIVPTEDNKDKIIIEEGKLTIDKDIKKGKVITDKGRINLDEEDQNK